MRESVEITMLGKFTIFGPGMAALKAVSLTGRARRLWILTAYLILNRDRHGANIEVLRNSRKKTVRLAPLFDHGLSLLCNLSLIHI